MSKRGTRRVVHSEVGNGQIGSRVDAHKLNRRVHKLKTGDGRRFQGVRVEELGLGLATVGSLSVPPACSTAVDFVPRCSGHCDGGAGNGDQRTTPLFVTKCSGAFEDNLGMLRSVCAEVCMAYVSAGLESSQIESGARWNSNA
jgi:hypothetical protein